MSVVSSSFASVFVFEESTNSMQFYFEQANSVFKSDSNFIIGAFVKRDYQLICIGSTSSVNKPTTMEMFVYGYDSLDKVGTALQGEEIIFAGMNINPKPRCEIILTPIDEQGNEVKVFFQKESVQKVYTWKQENVSFEYPSLVCGLEKDFFPVTTNIPFHAISIYRSNPNLLLNVSTGEILTEYSKEGKYKINWQLQVGESNQGNDVLYYCIEKDSFEITLVDTTPILTNDYFSLDYPICDEKGTLTIDTSFFSFDIKSIILKNEKEEEVITVSDIKIELPIGNYQLTEIVDKNKCVHPTASSFKMMTQGNCDKNYVLMPFNQNGPQEIFFEEEGELKIVNQQGKVVKRLIVPAIWDGKMNNGNFVDMGIYFIYNKEEYIQTLHVYR